MAKTKVKKKLSRVEKIHVSDGFFICIEDARQQMRAFKPSEIRAIYADSDTLREIQTIFDLSSKLVRKLLKLAKVKYLKDLAKEHQQGATWGDIARRHGMKLSTLTALIKERGGEIRAGRRAPRLAKPALQAAFEKLGTCAGVAKRFGIHWQTARKALLAHGIIQTPIRRLQDIP